MPSARLDELEDEVARRVAAERFDAEDIAAVSEEVRRALIELQASDQKEKEALRTQLKKLEAQGERLIELAADGTLAVEKLRQRLEYVTLQKGAISEKLSRTVERIQRGVDKAHAFVDLLEEPASLYRQLPDNVRRELLAAFFSRLDVQVADQTSPSPQNEPNSMGVYTSGKPSTASARRRTSPRKRRELPAFLRKALSD